MRWIKPLGILSGLVLIAACFMPWVIIESKHLVLTGVHTAGTNFGKPGYLHFFFTFIYIVLFLIPKIWSRRLNLFFAAFNMAWAVRNFIAIPACDGGECPVKQTGIYLVLIASAIMLFAVMFATEKVEEPIS